MKRTEYVCDRCGKIEFSETNFSPAHWTSITFNTTRITYKKDLCKECSSFLGIAQEERTYDENRENIGEHLIEILSEINRSINHL